MIEYNIVIDDAGNKLWYLNDKLHREDGPAIEYADGDKLWYLNGINYSESDFNIEINHHKDFSIDNHIKQC